MNICVCNRCHRITEYEVQYTYRFMSGNLEFMVYPHYFAHCKICGSEVFPDAVSIQNKNAEQNAAEQVAKRDAERRFREIRETGKIRREGNGARETMTRNEILRAAEKIVSGERQEQYGSPEDNFAAIARYWKCYLDARAKNGGSDATFTLDADDVAAMMILFKVGRLSTGAGSADTWIDIAGYAACGGQIQTANKNDGESPNET